MTVSRFGPADPSIDEFVPQPPHWKLDWHGIDAAYGWVRAMRGAQHDPVHHQEGDVWIHTRMVLDELVSSSEWRSLVPDERRIAFAATILHDVSKPATAETTPEGRVTNRGHSRIGALEARSILWRMGWPAALRERTCAIIAVHQVPFWLIERDRVEVLRFVAAQSMACGNRLLACVAEADALGRICDDPVRILENVQMFREIARDADCYDSPFPFPDDHTRFSFFSKPDSSIDPRWPLPAPSDVPEVILMSGLPASGKSSWLRDNALGIPVVSLDQWRDQLDIDADEPQGRVVQAAREAARVHMRKREPFAWDATNLSRTMRQPLIGLFTDYGYRVRIVAVECPPQEIEARNSARKDPVPFKAIQHMIRKWEHPSPVEAHAVESQAWSVGAPREAEAKDRKFS